MKVGVPTRRSHEASSQQELIVGVRGQEAPGPKSKDRPARRLRAELLPEGTDKLHRAHHIEFGWVESRYYRRRWGRRIGSGNENATAEGRELKLTANLGQEGILAIEIGILRQNGRDLWKAIGI